MNVNPRICNALSPQEMQRRWAAVRERMREQGVDALVVQNSSDWVGGHIRWFTNQPATNGYPTSAVFPVDGGISLIEQGPFGLVRETAGAADGIERRLTTPSYPSVAYTAAYDAELALGELKRLGARRVGTVAPAGWDHGFGAALRERRIAGAGPDVFRQQPLPVDSPWWREPNVIVTPLVGGMSDIYLQQAFPIVDANLRLFLQGRLGELHNTVARLPRSDR